MPASKSYMCITIPHSCREWWTKVGKVARINNYYRYELIVKAINSYIRNRLYVPDEIDLDLERMCYYADD